MGDQKQQVEIFLDFLPNQPKNEDTRESFRNLLRQSFEQKLPAAADRLFELPPILVRQEDYLPLLLESRELFIAGYFYSCVAVCGIVAERLVKDLLRNSILVERDGVQSPPTARAFDQFEYVDMSKLVQFLKEAGLLNEEAAKAALKLGQLRNRYAHARGKDPHNDAKNAIELLDKIVEHTVSLLKKVLAKGNVSAVLD
ncbi:MAG: hypothetical protein HYX72_09085 [Acidobacteria bacterium]|nr:hypothetical protein [Acidobacteriota bacterium]